MRGGCLSSQVYNGSSCMHLSAVIGQAAYLLVVLQSVLCDEESSAQHTAHALHLLVRLLRCSHKEKYLLLQCCRYIAALAHLRYGIPQTLVAAGVTPLLVNLLQSSSLAVSEAAAAALAAIATTEPTASRTILSVCRQKQHLFNLLSKRAPSSGVPSPLIEKWRCEKKCGLPRIK